MAETSDSAPPPDEGKRQRQQWPISWNGYSTEYLNKTVSESKDFVLRSTTSLESFSTPFRKSQELLPKIKSYYTVYEDMFFTKMKEGFMIARERPTPACGVAIATGLLLMRGPRRFLFRQTLGRFRSEEALLIKAEKSLTDLDQAVQLTRNESKKLLDRAGYAENAMLGAQTRLRDSATQIQKLVKDLYKAESKVTDFMDDLRELPGRDSLKLRAEVASMMDDMKQYRKQLEKRITRISEFGIPV